MSTGQRRWVRVAARLEAAYEDSRRQIFLPTRDVSVGGIFLLDADRPALGEVVQIALALPGERAILRLRGVVARRSGEDEAAPGFAVRFDDGAMPEADRAALEEFVREVLTPRAHEPDASPTTRR